MEAPFGRIIFKIEVLKCVVNRKNDKNDDDGSGSSRRQHDRGQQQPNVDVILTMTSADNSWRIRRDFASIRRLHYKMRELFPKEEFPTLPRISKHSAEYLDNLQHQLNVYFQVWAFSLFLVYFFSCNVFVRRIVLKLGKQS